MDEGRRKALEEKAAGPGLSDQEAVELGHLYAEEHGEAYADAATMHAEHAFDDLDQPLKERKRRGAKMKARAGDPGSVADPGFELNILSQAGRSWGH